MSTMHIHTRLIKKNEDIFLLAYNIIDWNYQNNNLVINDEPPSIEGRLQ